VKFWHVTFLPGQISWFPDSRETFLSLIIALGKVGHSYFAAAEHRRQVVNQV
jgi:hypothetical protein